MFYLRKMMTVAMLAEDGRGDWVLSLISFVELLYVSCNFIMRETFLPMY